MKSIFLESEERLQHSNGGLLRLAQLQEARVHVYVEGIKGDRTYYSRVLSMVARDYDFKMSFTVSRDIRGAGEGKKKCLDLHQEYFDKNKLISKLDDEITVSVFIVDKDIDDIEGKLIISDHLIYTLHHSVENHIVKESDVSRALAAAVGLDIATVSEAIGEPAIWLGGCFDIWKEWVAICILSRVTGANVINYKSASQLNIPCMAVTKSQDLNVWLARIGAKCHLSLSEISSKYQSVLDNVLLYRDRQEQDKLFKGKWYAIFLSEVGKRLGQNEGFNEKALWAALLCSLEEENRGSDIFRNAVYTLVRRAF